MPNKVCNRDILAFKKMAFFFYKDGIFLVEMGEWASPTTPTPSSQSGGLKCTLRINRESSSKRAVLLRDVNLYKRFRAGQISAKYSIFLHLKESSEFVARPMKNSCDLMAWGKKKKILVLKSNLLSLCLPSLFLFTKLPLTWLDPCVEECEAAGRYQGLIAWGPLRHLSCHLVDSAVGMSCWLMARA